MSALLSLFETSAAERVGWMLVHSIWQLGLLAGLYYLLQPLLQRCSASARYLTACFTMTCMVLVLPLTAMLVTVQTSSPRFIPKIVARSTPEKMLVSEPLPAAPSVVPSSLPDLAPTEAPAPIKMMEEEPVSWKNRLTTSLAPALPWIVMLWFIGVLALGIRQFGGWIKVRQLCRTGTKPVDDALFAKMRQISAKLGITKTVSLLSSTSTKIPSIIGHLKPVILLPASLISGLSRSQLEAIVAHELAHVRRHDYLINLIQSACETVLFYHPATWWISREIRREREHCCDDLAVQVCGDRIAYARALATLEESRAVPIATVAATGGSLIQRIRRLVIQPTKPHTPRGTWLAGALAILSMCVVLPIALAMDGNASDFNFKNPPAGYEQKIRMANPDQSIKAGKLRFQLSDLTRGADGVVEGSLGLKNGYEVVAFRLFDHAARELFFDSQWQLNIESDPSTREFNASRVGESDQIRIEEKGGTIPEEIDLWLRIVENGQGDRFHIPAREGASAKIGGSEIVITSLLAGNMNGKGSPSGKMIWDLATAHDTTWRTTLDLESRGKVLRGRYHVVAVTKDGWRHAMDHIHFVDFSHGRHKYVNLDVAPDQIDHFELIPFKARHKFFFNAVKVPKQAAPDEEHPLIDTLNGYLRTSINHDDARDFLLALIKDKQWELVHDQRNGTPRFSHSLIAFRAPSGKQHLFEFYAEDGQNLRILIDRSDRSEVNNMAVSYMKFVKIANSPHLPKRLLGYTIPKMVRHLKSKTVVAPEFGYIRTSLSSRDSGATILNLRMKEKWKQVKGRSWSTKDQSLAYDISIISQGDTQFEIEQVIEKDQDVFLFIRPVGDTKVRPNKLTEDLLRQMVQLNYLSSDDVIRIEGKLRKKVTLPKMIRHVDTLIGVTYDRPADWVIDKNPPPNGQGTSFLQPWDLAGGVQGSLRISMEENGGPASVDITSPGNPKATASRIFEIDGRPARLTAFTVNPKSEAELLHVQFARGTKSYLIQMVFPKARHDELIALALAVSESIRFISPKAPDNPLGLSNATLTRLFNTGKLLRAAAGECLSYRRKYGKNPASAEVLFENYEQFQPEMIVDPFAPKGGVLRLTTRTDESGDYWLQVWSVGQNGVWDGGKINDDLGAESRIGNHQFNWLANETMAMHLEGKRLAHYLAAQTPTHLGRPINPHQTLVWGPVVDGLCMAAKLTPKKDTYAIGEKIDLEFHIRNVSPHPITIAGFSWRQDNAPDSFVINNEKGEKLNVQHTWYSGETPIQRDTLKVGHVAIFKSSALAFMAEGIEKPKHPIGHTAMTEAGLHTLQFNLNFPDGSQSGAEGMPRATDWQGILQSGVIKVPIVNP